MRNSYIFIQENVFENVVRKLAAILSRPGCVKTTLWHLMAWCCIVPMHLWPYLSLCVGDIIFVIDIARFSAEKVKQPFFYQVFFSKLIYLIVAVPGSSLGLAQSILTDTSFKSLEDKVSESSLKGIADMSFTHMTEIQAKSIPHLLEGR